MQKKVSYIIYKNGGHQKIGNDLESAIEDVLRQVNSLKDGFLPYHFGISRMVTQENAPPKISDKLYSIGDNKRIGSKQYIEISKEAFEELLETL